MAGRKLDTPEMDTSALPIMAAHVLNQSAAENGVADDLMTELRQMLVRRLKRDNENADKEINRKKKIAMMNAQAAQEEMAERRRKQAACNHLKLNNRDTRLRGQVVTGDREGRGKQLVLVCGFCGKSYHYPPKEGQEVPPQHLLPPADEIGNWGSL